MDVKYVVGIAFAVMLCLFFIRIQRIIERERVKEMRRICREDYGMVYSHHDNYYFWCYKPAENIMVDIERIQWGEFEKPFEVPKINMTGISKNVT